MTGVRRGGTTAWRRGGRRAVCHHTPSPSAFRVAYRHRSTVVGAEGDAAGRMVSRYGACADGQKIDQPPTAWPTGTLLRAADSGACCAEVRAEARARWSFLWRLRSIGRREAGGETVASAPAPASCATRRCRASSVVKRDVHCRRNAGHTCLWFFFSFDFCFFFRPALDAAPLLPASQQRAPRSALVRRSFYGR